MLSRFYIAFCICLALFPHNAKSDSSEVEYVYPISTAWTEEKNAFGVPKTPYISYMHALFLEAGLHLKIRAVPPKRMFQEFKDGKSQFGLLVKAPALKECCLFSKQPITQMPINVYYHKGLPPIHSKDDLVGKNLGMIQGYSYGPLRKFFETHKIKSPIRSALNHESLFKAIMAREKEEYAINYGPISEEIIQRLSLDFQLPYRDLQKSKLLDINLYFVVSKALPDAKIILEKLEKASTFVNVKRFEEAFLARRQ